MFVVIQCLFCFYTFNSRKIEVKLSTWNKVTWLTCDTLSRCFPTLPKKIKSLRCRFSLFTFLKILDLLSLVGGCISVAFSKKNVEWHGILVWNFVPVSKAFWETFWYFQVKIKVIRDLTKLHFRVILYVGPMNAKSFWKYYL